MAITFGQFRNSGTAKRMSGVSTDSCDFAQYTNQAVDQLLRRGKWWNTFRSLRACVYEDHVTWPRHVQTILAIRNGRNVQNVYNQWFNFLPMEHCGYFYRDINLNRMRGHGHTVSEGTSPVFNPIGCNQNNYLEFFLSSPTDQGKTITIIGIDGNGQFVRTQRNDGTVQDGVVLTLALPFAVTPIPFRHVLRVIKDETNYPVRGYQIDPSGTLLPLCYYEGSETNPEYVRTHVGMNRGRAWTGCCQMEVEALVKIKFVPVKYDGDLMLIDNEAAVVNMIMAQRMKESGDLANARAYEADAFRELNFQMKDYFPDEQFVVDFQPFGRDELNRDEIRIGML